MKQLLVSGIALAELAGPVCAGTPADHGLWIENVTVVSPERAQPLTRATVKIENERIVQIVQSPAGERPPGTQLIDARGLFLTPGLIDGHVHLGQIPGMLPDHERAHPDIAMAARAQFPKSYLYFGFTTLVDLNSSREALAPWNAQPLHPDTYFCGGVPIMDGYPSNFMPEEVRYQAMPFFLVESGTAALPAGIVAAEHTPKAVVARMHAQGAICVKAFYEHGFGANRDLPVPSLASIQALVEAAHAAGLPVLLHANSSEAQEFGLQAGVDIFAHGLWNWRQGYGAAVLTPDVTRILQGVLDGGRGYEPTIQVLYGEQGLMDEKILDDPLMVKALPASLLDWYKSPQGQWYHDAFAKREGIAPSERPSGVDAGAIAHVNQVVSFMAQHDARLLFGSDTPSDETFANPPGLNGWLEMQRLAAAGVSAAQLFRAITIADAQAFGLSKDIGTVEVGKRANLLLLNADPTQTIHAYDKIEKVILAGRPIDPDTLAANRPAGPPHPAPAARPVPAALPVPAARPVLAAPR
jgi:imidazolonepropionase-like amidohydrolase